MNGPDRHVWLRVAILVFVWLPTCPALAQFTSGSTGALGAFAPASNTTVVLPADGILNYTTVTIPAGVTVTFQRNSANTPVTLLATGDVSIAGTLNLNGQNSVAGSAPGTTPTPGGLGGPGGYAGGQGGPAGSGNTTGSSGQGVSGGMPGLLGSHASGYGWYGAESAFVALLPLFGGSGGGGGSGSTTASGASGAGGGGALVVASTTQITVQSTGQILANGGNGLLDAGVNCNWHASGAGSGGAIRLVAPTLTVATANTVQAAGGQSQGTSGLEACESPGAGRIRLECTTCSLQSTTPAASVVNTLGPITAASTPPLTTLPTLTISSVGGITAPSSPAGSYTSADMTLPANTTNPVSVTLTATNVPTGTTFLVKVLPEGGIHVPFTSTPSTGSFSSSTATASLSIPYARTSLLYAYASFTQVASLFPLIDGEPVDHVLVAAAYGGHSTITLITRSGKEVPVTQLAPEDRLRVAKAFEAMRQRAQ